MTIDAGGHLVTSPFIDPHLHLDAALTAGNPRYNRSGSHPEGIQVWGEYKQQFPGFEDFNARARQAVEWEVAQGTIYIRTHIDICDPNLAALNQMLALREELRDIAEIQIVAFPQDGILSQPKNRELMEEALKLGADLVGGIPHCEFTREDGVESIAIIYDLAEKYDRDIDIHCDETDDQHSRFLEVAAAQAIRRGYQGRVSAGHTTAMHSYNNAYAFKLQGLLQLAGIHIIANPFDNIVLMGRFDTYPKRRGVTRVKELLQAGVNVCLGHDSIMDPWYPLGKGDMLEAALLAVHICHMSGADEIRRIFDTITVNAARAFGISETYGIEEGRKADFVILDCDTIMDAVRLSPARRYVIKAGRVVARTQPARSQVDYPKQPVSVDFKKPDDSA
jgi:cytosine deaminase